MIRMIPKFDGRNQGRLTYDTISRLDRLFILDESSTMETTIEKGTAPSSRIGQLFFLSYRSTWPFFFRAPPSRPQRKEKNLPL